MPIQLVSNDLLDFRKEELELFYALALGKNVLMFYLVDFAWLLCPPDGTFLNVSMFLNV